MFRISICTVLGTILATVSGAQSVGSLLSKAPPDVESALRASLDEYYKLYQAGKLRATEALVCEDSKDAYYNANKREYTGLEIVAIRYAEDFRKAEVSGKASGTVMTTAGELRAAFPVNSLWRVEGGKWCLYLPPPAKEVQTPFGTSVLGSGGPAGASAGIPAAARMPTVQDIVKLVQVPRTQFTLQSVEKSADEISITNGMGGVISLDVSAPPRDGLKVIADPPTIEAGKVGKLRLEYNPPDKSPKPAYVFTLIIEPIGKRYEMKAVFDIPEEVKKQFPAGLRP
jgi:hypothetical protein